MLKPKVTMFFTLVIMFILFSCSSRESDQPLLSAEVPLHFEEHLDAVTIVGSEVREDLFPPVEWHFNKPQPNWKAARPSSVQWEAVKPVQVEDALHLPLTKANNTPGDPNLVGGIYVKLPNLNIMEWGVVEIRARTQDPMLVMGLDFNYIEGKGRGLFPFSFRPFRTTPLVTDGSIQTYQFLLDKSFRVVSWDERPLTELGIWFVSQPDVESATLDILSVRILPITYFYDDSVGIKTVDRSGAYRSTLFNHTPGKLEYRIKVPKTGRFDVGLGVLQEDIPVTFKITAILKGREEIPLFEEAYSDSEHWAQRSVDLSKMEGQKITLRLETDAELAGTVSLWAAPTLSGIRATKKPNIILYIIDGASADYMSVYGYNRRTTPNLERLAAEGAVFEHAYSNSTWTKVSNPSFMTSLYHSVLGGYTSESSQLPDKAFTMAQLLHSAQYQTGVFTTNPYCGTMSGFDRGVDWLRESREGDNIASSRELQKDFWEWREAHPGEPYWVHFQTTDVHWPWKPATPFAGLFLMPELRMRYFDWERKVAKAAGLSNPTWPSPQRLSLNAFKEAGINHLEFFEAARCLNDEAMAHNDYQIGKLVERLKNSGEWENTLLIIAADHGSWFGLGLYDPVPPFWGPRFRSYESHIPMIFVWPGHIAPGLRLRQPVSMIDMLPTVLELAGLPEQEGMQGQSLAPLLLGKAGWVSRPVIFDEFYNDPKTGTLMGKIEVIDGRWGASLSIGLRPDEMRRPINRLGPPPPFPVMIYDVWEDPDCLIPLNEKRSDLVKKYTEFLEAKWKEHQAIAKWLSRSDDAPLTSEQLETLRSLGYIR
jgi:arylsulfatase A-like enzyme